MYDNIRLFIAIQGLHEQDPIAQIAEQIVFCKDTLSIVTIRSLYFLPSKLNPSDALASD